MNAKLIKIILSVIIIAILIAIGNLIYELSKLSGNSGFYLPLLVISISVMGIWLICWIFDLLKKKIAIISLSIILIVPTVSVLYYYTQQEKTIEISETNNLDDNLWEYEPFAVDTKAAILDRPSSLTLENDLPRIDGATAFYPVYAAFVQAVYPEKNYNRNSCEEIKCSKTPGAYDRLINGEVDIIFCFAPSIGQLQEAKEKGVILELTPIGKEAFIFFVNENNKVNNITSEQIKDIYAGDITSWDKVGGTHDKILVYQRPQNSGSQTMLTQIMGNRAIIDPPKDAIIHSMGEIIDRTSSYKNYKNAIGYSFLYYATSMADNNKIKILEIDNIYPNKQTIGNGEYPFIEEFYAIKTNKNTNSNVDRFIDWIKSSEGQYLIEKSGYTPLN